MYVVRKKKHLRNSRKFIEFGWAFCFIASLFWRFPIRWKGKEYARKETFIQKQKWTTFNSFVRLQAVVNFVIACLCFFLRKYIFFCWCEQPRLDSMHGTRVIVCAHSREPTNWSKLICVFFCWLLLLFIAFVIVVIAITRSVIVVVTFESWECDLYTKKMLSGNRNYTLNLYIFEAFMAVCYICFFLHLYYSYLMPTTVLSLL